MKRQAVFHDDEIQIDPLYIMYLLERVSRWPVPMTTTEFCNRRLANGLAAFPSEGWYLND